MASNCLEIEVFEAGGFHAGDELGCDLEDAEGDGIVDVVDLESLLLHLGDGFGRYSLNFAGDEIVGGEFSKARLAHRLRIFRSDILNFHGDEFVEIDVVAGGFHLVDVVTVGCADGAALSSD